MIVYCDQKGLISVLNDPKNPTNLFQCSIVVSFLSNVVIADCDGKSTKIPKRDFIFARVKTGQVGT